jgi:hypothetical protein
MKRMMVSKNQLVVVRPSELFLAALMIPRAVVAIPRRLAMIAIMACICGPNPKSKDMVFRGISFI